MPFRWDVLIGTISFLVALSVIMGVVVLRKGRGRSGESYLHGDKKLGPWVAGVTYGLSSIGAFHITGIMESGATLGLISLWFALGSGVAFAVIGGFFARIYRGLNKNTVPAIFAHLFDQKTRIAASIIGIIIMFIFLSLEIQGGGIIIASITGLDLHPALFLFTACALLYVLISGMWQITYINIINSIVMYVFVIVAFILVTLKLPAGWSGVDSFYIGKGLESALQFWPSDVNLLIGFALAYLFAHVFTDSVNHLGLQYVLNAADAGTARKTAFIAVLINAPFAFFTVSFGLASRTLPEIAAIGPKMSGPAMLLSFLPPFVIVLLLGSFLFVVLSTWAACTMGISQIVINDFFLHFSNKTDAEKKKTTPWLSRVLIVVLALLALIPAYFLPHVILTGLFVFTFGIPLFVMMVTGLFWKRNSNVAFATMIAGAIGTFVWEYTSLSVLLSAPEWFSTPYFTLVISVILGLGLTAVLPGKPGLLVKNRVAASTKAV